MGLLKTLNKMLKTGQVSSEILCIKAEDVKNRVAMKTTEKQIKWIHKMVQKYGVEEARKLIEATIAINKGNSSLKKLLELEIAKQKTQEKQD